MKKDNCIVCQQFKSIYSRGMCTYCYRKSLPNGVCTECKQKKHIHAKGLCENCYSKKLHRENKEHYNEYIRNWRKKNLLKERGRDRRNIGSPAGKARRLRHATKKKIAYFEYMQKYKPKCVRCGHSESLRSLSFHHLNPSQKSFDMCYREWWRTRIDEVEKRFDEERKKCIVLCLNCHASLEDGTWNIEKNNSNT